MTKESLSRRFKRFGYRQVPVWYESSRAVAQQFSTIGEHLKLFKVIPNPYPFYDLIMGLYERWSNRAALRGPVLQRVECILDVGSGTGHLLGQIVGRTRKSQMVVAVDLSRNYGHELALLVAVHREACAALPEQAAAWTVELVPLLQGFAPPDLPVELARTAQAVAGPEHADALAVAELVALKAALRDDEVIAGLDALEGRLSGQDRARALLLRAKVARTRNSPDTDELLTQAVEACRGDALRDALTVRGFVRMVAREVRSYLDALELKEDLKELLTGYSLEISLSLKPLEAALQRAEDEPADEG